MSDELDWSDVPDVGRSIHEVVASAFERYRDLTAYDLKVLARSYRRRERSAEQASGYEEAVEAARERNRAIVTCFREGFITVLECDDPYPTTDSTFYGPPQEVDADAMQATWTLTLFASTCEALAELREEKRQYRLTRIASDTFLRRAKLLKQELDSLPDSVKVVGPAYNEVADQEGVTAAAVQRMFNRAVEGSDYKSVSDILPLLEFAERVRFLKKPLGHSNVEN